MLAPPTLTGPHVTSHPGSEVPERFHYECQVNFNETDANVLYQANVTFLFDGEELEGTDKYPIGVIIVNSSNPVAVLHDYHLRLRLGKTVGYIDNDMYLYDIYYIDFVLRNLVHFARKPSSTNNQQ